MAQKTFNDTKINVKFDEATSRQQLNSGENISTLFGKIKKIFSDLKAICFSGSYNDLSDTPTTATTDSDGLMSAEDKGKLDNADNTYALKAKYGDTTINVGRKAGTIVGHFSTAEGQATTASSLCSHAEGDQTTASGNFSHSEGEQTKAIGAYSHAEGCRTEANGRVSHAEGRETTAFGDYSHTSGYYTKALHDNEAAYGKYNESNDNTLFSVGDGTADDARHNAFEITTTGGKLHDEEIMTQNKISNPNLLTNPDFSINQREISGAFSDTGKYFVDRWRLVSGTVTVNSDGTLTLNGSICQPLENAVGTNVTASVSAGTAVYDNTTQTFTITGNGEIISWAKLEYGGTATQFIPPDTVTELLKCMRYYEILIPSDADRAVTGYLETGRNAIFDMKFSVPKRCVPSLTSNFVRIIVNTFDSYLAILDNCPVSQGGTDKHGIVIASTDPVISSVSSGYIGVTMDAIHNETLAVDAEIY